MSRLLTAGCLLVIAAAPAAAQSRHWANAASGLWMDAVRWTPADAPDTVTESAVFDRFGTYSAFLAGGATTTVDDVDQDFGALTLSSDASGDATLHAAGDVTVGGSLLIEPIAGTTTDLVVDGALLVEGGGSVTAEQSSLQASVASIAGGTAAEPTRFRLLDGSSAVFDSLSIADAGSGANRGVLDINGGSVVETGLLRIAAESVDPLGELTIIDGRLTQTAGNTVIGLSIDGVNGNGTLGVSPSGIAELRTVSINGSGSLQNAGGHISVSGSLLVLGGTYAESGAATRDFSDTANVSVSSGGLVSLVGEPLLRTSGRRVTVADGTLVSPGGVVIEPGARLSVGGSAESVLDASVDVAAGGEVVVGNGGLTRVLSDFTDHGAEVRFLNGGTLAFEGAYQGGGAIGNGLMRFEGDSSAGVGIGSASITTNAEWTATARLVAELQDATAHDAFAVGGTATIDGALTIELLDDFQPAEGDAFTLLTAGSLGGAFDTLDAPELAGGREWRILQTPTSLTAKVVSPSVAGDFNYDGLIDAADYTVWRDTAGSEGPSLAADANGDRVVDALDRGVWLSAYGDEPAPAAVPEASAFWLLAPLVAGLVARSADRP